MDQRMVVGFAFSPRHTHVKLILKNRGPGSVRGRYNGIGGHVQEGESEAEATSREFQEEAGVLIPPSRWTRTVTLLGDGWMVDFFRATLTDAEWEECQSTTDEPIISVCVADLREYWLATHVDWIIPFSLNDAVEIPLVVRDHS